MFLVTGNAHQYSDTLPAGMRVGQIPSLRLFGVLSSCGGLMSVRERGGYYPLPRPSVALSDSIEDGSDASKLSLIA